MSLDPNSICMWPDNSWCYVEELEEMAHNGDDFYVINFNSLEWHHITYEDNYGRS